ncbi:hypothetical protein D9M72_572540 [compost metagenome]
MRQILAGGLQPSRQADLEIGKGRRRNHADGQRIDHHAFADAPRIGLDHRAVHRQHDGRKGVVEQDHQRRQDRPEGNPVVAVHARRQRQANDPVVTAKGTLGVDPPIFPRALPDRPNPGDGKTHQGRKGKIDQQRRLQRRVQVGMQDAQKQQRRHGDVEHQC